MVGGDDLRTVVPSNPGWPHQSCMNPDRGDVRAGGRGAGARVRRRAGDGACSAQCRRRCPRQRAVRPDTRRGEGRLRLHAGSVAVLPEVSWPARCCRAASSTFAATSEGWTDCKSLVCAPLYQVVSRLADAVEHGFHSLLCFSNKHCVAEPSLLLSQRSSRTTRRPWARSGHPRARTPCPGRPAVATPTAG